VGPSGERPSGLSPPAQPLIAAVARLLALTPDLMFASRIEATLTAAGHEVQLASSVAEASGPNRPDLVLVDLDRVAPEPVVELGAPALGFFSHTDVEARERAQAAGVDLVVPRSRMAREMPQLVSGLLDKHHSAG
jgi:hypothetical protein